MEFQMKSSGLHMYHPNETNKSNITFINTVLDNIKEFTKREIKGEKRRDNSTPRCCIHPRLQIDDTEKLYQQL